MRNVFRVFLSFSISILVALTALGAPAQAATTGTAGPGGCLEWGTVDSSVTITNGKTCTGSLSIPATIDTGAGLFPVTQIGVAAFSPSSISGITIPNSVTTIQDNAFFQSDISSVQFQTPSSLVSIGTNSFRNTPNLESISLPDSLRTIGFASFFNLIDGRKSLSTIDLGNGVTNIAGDAFVGALASSLTIPASVEYIGSDAFKGLNNLTTITFGTGSRLKGLDRGNVFFDIPDGLTPTFKDLPSLSHVVYCSTPPSIISNYAFPNSVSVSKFGCPITAISKVSNPSVIGSAKKGKVLRQVAGQWNGSNPLVSYQWYRCSKQVKSSLNTKPAKCSSIAGARGQSYKLAKKDKNKYVLVAVTARNSISSLTSWSKSTKKIK